NISRSIINHVLGQKKAVLSQDAGNDMNLPTSASIADLKIRSVMCAPLLTPDGEALGILQLDTSDRKQFGQEDLDVLVAVASQAVPAALMMAKFSGDTRYCILTEEGAGAAASALNDLLCDAGIEERFITLSLKMLDLTGGVLTLASAGHPPVLIRRADGS